MKLTGYSDIWSTRQKDVIRFYVHCEAPNFEAQLIRLQHGDESPYGPGHKSKPVSSAADGTYPGQSQSIYMGSYGVASLEGLDLSGDEISLSCWVWPTLFGPQSQGLVSWAPSGLSLSLDHEGHVLAQSGAALVRSPAPLGLREWYHLTVKVSLGQLHLSIRAKRWQPAFDALVTVSAPAGVLATGQDQTLLIAAAALNGRQTQGHFNGRLAAPVISCAGKRVAAWDFGLAPETWTLRETVGGRDGTLINAPARSMPGPDWPSPESLSTAALPQTHNAVHFHDDDVADLGWDESFRLTIPETLPSGVYAMKLTSGDAFDYLPFFVSPAKGARCAKLAVLMPTMSYLAYANESLDVSDAPDLSPRQNMALNPEGYAYVAKNGLKSLYDRHSDGSSIIYGTRRRPIIDFRPHHRCRTFDAPHQFGADLHLIDWLTESGYEFDIVTDDLLHDEAEAALGPYRVVISGSHPEYWTGSMLAARDRWLDAGGRFMYLGGNGFYWVTGVSAVTPDLIEVRRYSGTRTSSSFLGEETLSTTGERGGLWRERGQPPQARMGVGFSGQGFDRGVPYRRRLGPACQSWDWVFDGVTSDVFGAGPALVLGHGAAGFEIDRVSPLYGTPSHTVVLASTDRFTDAYQGVIEERNSLDPWSGGSDPRSGIRSDVTITPGPNDGAVFAAGSITWCSTLSASNYDSDMARITRNVLDRFLRDGPLVPAKQD